MTTPGFDGVRRIFAYVRVPWTQARLAVGLDESAVQAGIDREIDLAYLQLGAVRHSSFCCWPGSAASNSWCGRSARWCAPRRVSAAAICMCARRRSPGSPNSRRSPPRLTTWRPSSPRARRNCRSPTSISRNWRASTASPGSPTGAASTASSSGNGSAPPRRSEPVALMMIDIDHFKLFNDRYGHVAGDTCLRAVGETLSLVTLEEAVLVARYGGEEFALLLPGLDIDARDRRLPRRRARSIEDLLINHSESPCGHVTISIGVESMVPDKLPDRRPIWSRRPTARSMPPSGAAAIPWSRTTPVPAARGVVRALAPLIRIYASSPVLLCAPPACASPFRRRPDHAFELHAVGIGEIDRVIIAAVIFARRIDHSHAVLFEKGAELVDVLAAGTARTRSDESRYRLCGICASCPRASAAAIQNSVLPLLQPAMSAYSYLSLKPRNFNSLP